MMNCAEGVATHSLPMHQRDGCRSMAPRSKSATISGRIPQNQVETSGVRPFVTQCQVGGRQGTRGQVGDNIGLHGRHGRSGGRFGACSPQACTRCTPGCSSRHPDQRVRIVLRTSCPIWRSWTPNEPSFVRTSEMSRKRLLELNAQSVLRDGVEVQHLRGLVSQLQAQIEMLRQNPSRDHQPEGSSKVGEKILFFSATRRSGWLGATPILHWCWDRPPRWPESHGGSSGADDSSFR